MPSGSGDDFRRTVDVSASIAEAVAHIRFGQRRRCDLGVVHAVDDTGAKVVRAFVNEGSLGASGVVGRLVQGASKGRFGRAAYAVSTLRALATFRNPELRVRIDGTAFFEGRAFEVVIANGRYFGGGMKIAPHADPSDGRLEVVLLGDLGRAELLALGPRIYAGAHLGAQGVSLGGGRVVEVEAVQPWQSILLETDGEAMGRLPVRAAVLPGALTVRA